MTIDYSTISSNISCDIIYHYIIYVHKLYCVLFFNVYYIIDTINSIGTVNVL